MNFFRETPCLCWAVTLWCVPGLLHRHGVRDKNYPLIQ
jgi:hypothetical protein